VVNSGYQCVHRFGAEVPLGPVEHNHVRRIGRNQIQQESAQILVVRGELSKNAWMCRYVESVCTCGLIGMAHSARLVVRVSIAARTIRAISFRRERCQPSRRSRTRVRRRT
jgi:hypothetical protein